VSFFIVQKGLRVSNGKKVVNARQNRKSRAERGRVYLEGSKVFDAPDLHPEGDP
jgi:hypothetical protein